MNERKCPSCNACVSEKDLFCSNCGHELNGDKNEPSRIENTNVVDTDYKLQPWHMGLIAIIIAVTITFFNNNEMPNGKEKGSTYRQERTEKCVRKFRSYIKQELKDPSSFEYISFSSSSISSSEDGSVARITVDFRANNSFGAKVKGRAIADYNIISCVRVSEVRNF